MKPPMLRTLLLAAALFLLPAQCEAYMSMFLKLSGIEGESTDKGHEKWIEINSLSFGGSPKGSVRTPGLNFSLQLSKYADISTLKVIEKMLFGDSIDTADIEFTRVSRVGETLFYKIKLEEVYVVSEVMDGNTGDVRPSETLILGCRKITWTLTTFNSAALTSDYQSFWDFFTNEGGKGFTGKTFGVTAESVSGRSLRLHWTAFAGETFQIRGAANVSAPFGLKYEVTAPNDGEMVFDVPVGDPMQFLTVIRTD
jgi:type VI secretion system secreted protein Hcp